MNFPERRTEEEVNDTKVGRAGRECEKNPPRQQTDVSSPPRFYGNQHSGQNCWDSWMFIPLFSHFFFFLESSRGGREEFILFREEIRRWGPGLKKKRCCFQKSFSGAFSGFQSSLLYWEVSGRNIHTYKQEKHCGGEVRWIPLAADVNQLTLTSGTPQVASRGDAQTFDVFLCPAGIFFPFLYFRTKTRFYCVVSDITGQMNDNIFFRRIMMRTTLGRPGERVVVVLVGGLGLGQSGTKWPAAGPARG